MHRVLRGSDFRRLSMLWKGAFVAVVLGVMVACATSPTGRAQLQLFPSTQLAQMGVAAFDNLREELPETEDRQLRGYVACVADAIIAQVDEHPEADWEVVVFDDDSANAFALPGGKIGVHAGLLQVAENQHQLATVIGHEIAHVTAEHANERVSTAYATEAGLALVGALADGDSRRHNHLMGLLGLGAQVGILLPFNRTQEREADIVGLDLMAEAGFDPRESVALWRNMEALAERQPPEFLSTHPSHGRRIDDLQDRLPRAMELYRQAQAQGRRPDCS